MLLLLLLQLLPPLLLLLLLLLLTLQAIQRVPFRVCLRHVCVCVVCLMTVVAAAGLGTYYCDGKRRFTTDENLPDVFH